MCRVFTVRCCHIAYESPGVTGEGFGRRGVQCTDNTDGTTTGVLSITIRVCDTFLYL